jgi:hypothetical protein
MTRTTMAQIQTTAKILRPRFKIRPRLLSACHAARCVAGHGVASHAEPPTNRVRVTGGEEHSAPVLGVVFGELEIPSTSRTRPRSRHRVCQAVEADGDVHEHERGYAISRPVVDRGDHSGSQRPEPEQKHPSSVRRTLSHLGAMAQSARRHRPFVPFPVHRAVTMPNGRHRGRRYGGERLPSEYGLIALAIAYGLIACWRRSAS